MCKDIQNTEGKMNQSLCYRTIMDIIFLKDSLFHIVKGCKLGKGTEQIPENVRENGIWNTLIK